MTQGPVFLAVHDAVHHDTMETVFCALAELDYRVNILLMPEHSPKDQPWGNPTPCGVRYPCVPDAATSEEECSSLHETLVRLFVEKPSSTR